MTSDFSLNPPLKPTSKSLIRTTRRLLRKSHYSQRHSTRFWQKLRKIITTFRNPLKPRRIHRLLRTLPPRSRLTGELHHWKEESLKILLACGPSKMRSAHQNSMSSSSRQNSKETLIWISRTSLTTSGCLSIRWLASDKTYLMITSPSKETLSLKNTLPHIAITLPTPGISRYTFLLDTHY